MDKFDTLEGIEEYLKDGLAGFNRLLKDRGEATKDPKEGPPWDKRRLKDFWILGRWQVDTFGQCHVIIGGAPKSVPAVVEDIWEYLPKDTSLSTTIQYPPRHDALCTICGVGWTLEDAYTAEWRHEDDLYAHKACSHQKREEIDLSNFKEAFNKADPTRKYTFNPIPNEYCNCNLCTVWYEVRIAGCKGFIKVGWRKRVINLDWSANGTSVEVTQDNVTKNPYLVHAWGYAKMTEYLKVLLPKLKSC